jgi:hypothetical protein
MFHLRVRPIASHFFRVVMLCLLLVLIVDNRSFTHKPSSQVAAQEPTATPNPLAIQPGECTRDLFNNLMQGAIQSWTDTGQLSQDMLNSLLYGMTNCYASLDVATVPTCDQQAAQQEIVFILNSLSTQHPLTNDEYQSLLQVLNTCYSAPPSQVTDQGPTATPNPLAIQPGECTHDAFNSLMQAAIQSWTDTGQLSQDMLNSLLYGMTNCYASLDVAGVPTCDQQAAQQEIVFILNSLSTQHSLTSDEYQSLLQVLNTCYGSELNINALTVGGLGGSAGNNGGGNGDGAGGGNSAPGGGGQGDGGGSTQPGGPAEEYVGPYHAVKVMDLGGETLDGTVCTINQLFVVSMATPKINFDIQFVPTDKTQGTWTYAYNFPDLGETHDASGGYTISAPAADGTRSLTIDGSDHVVFNGFDGSIPMHYIIGLSPSAEAACGG